MCSVMYFRCFHGTALVLGVNLLQHFVCVCVGTCVTEIEYLMAPLMPFFFFFFLSAHNVIESDSRFHVLGCI